VGPAVGLTDRVSDGDPIDHGDSVDHGVSDDDGDSVDHGEPIGIANSVRVAEPDVRGRNLTGCAARARDRGGQRRLRGGDVDVDAGPGWGEL